jgi:hypothetical protein
MLKNGGMQTNDYCPGDEVQQRGQRLLCIYPCFQ